MSVLFSDLIKRSVVNIEPEFAVLHFDKQNRSSSSSLYPPDPSSLFVLFEVPVKLHNLVVAECINLLDWHCLSFFQIDR